MKKPIRLKAKSTQQGIVLLEALVAVLLFSMGVLALVGLQAAMMKNTEDSKFRSEASYIAQQRLGMMWTNPNLIISETDTNISAQLPNGTRTVSVSGVSEVTITIGWQQPGKDRHQFTTTANITGG
ncbi:MAG: prepilin-type cleavage/methylation domain-containing protein [Gallionella sp.]